MSRGTGASEKGVKFLAGVGAVALVFAIVWIGAQAVELGAGLTSGLASSLSGVRSFFGPRGSIVLVTEPSEVESEEPVRLSWEHIGERTEGTYTFSYTCTDGVHFISPASTNVGNVIFCNTPFPLGGDADTLELAAVSTAREDRALTLTMSFTESGSDHASERGETELAVVIEKNVDEEAAAATTTPEIASESTEPASAPAPVTQPVVVPASDPNGTPDLTVRILAVGTVTTSGAFTRVSGPVDPDDRLAVRFEVANVGTKTSDSWEFEAKLPTETAYTYTSPKQEGLVPGSRVEYTLGFEDAEDDDETLMITIEVDPDDDVDEQRESNNTASITVGVEN